MKNVHESRRDAEGHATSVVAPARLVTKTLVVAVGLLALTAPVLARGGARSDPALPPQRFSTNGLHVRMPPSRHGLVRVVVSLDSNPVAAAANRDRRDLTGTPMTRGRASLKPKPVSSAAAARKRAVALRSLGVAAYAAAPGRDRVARAIVAAKGRVVGADPLSNSIEAVVPAGALATLVRRADVQAIEAVSPQLAMGALANESAAVGAPTWWTAGYRGGSGTPPDGTTSIAILNDKIEEEQPLFDSGMFERPQGAPRNTPCGQGTPSCEHGTGVAGMAVAVGNSVCAELCTADTGAEKGIAHGAVHVLDADFDGSPDTNFSVVAWALGIPQPAIYPRSGTMPGAVNPAQVMSDSHGSYVTGDDGIVQQNLDTLAPTYGVTLTEPSGNDGLRGSGSGHITETCVAYNVICVGGIGVNDPTTTSDDAIANFSSQGPSPGGRKKPDLVAIAAGSAGGANMVVAEQRWSYFNRLERGDTGTSFASPQVAGAAAILHGAGITSPMAQKALLINSSTLGRATPASAMGTQAGWQPDWGWGELNLDAAFHQREYTNLGVDSVGARDVRFYRADVAAGDRATLVWNRRSNGCFTAGCGDPHAMTLSNLDLYQYDAGTQARQAASESAIDNVEQVRSPSAATVIYKVKDQSSSVDGMAAEPFGLAAAGALTPLTAPRPTVRLELDRTSVHRDEPVTLTATVTNPSADIAGSAAQVALTIPSGMEIATGGDSTWSAGRLSAGASATHVWTLKGTTDAIHQLSATAEEQAYEETFTSAPATVALDVDSTAPTANLDCPRGETTTPALAVVWSAADVSPVAAYDVFVSTDGGPFVPWLTGSTRTSATFPAQIGHGYSFGVRATDALGNISERAECGPVTVRARTTDPTPTPVPPTLGDPLPAPARLRLSRIAIQGTSLVVSGSLDRDATGTVRVSYAASGTTGHGSATILRGRFRVAVRLAGRLRRARRGTVRVSYSGDAHHSGRRLTRRFRRQATS